MKKRNSGDDKCFLNDYEFISVITSPYNSILWKLGNIDFDELLEETKMKNTIGEYPAIKYDPDTNTIFIIFALDYLPNAESYKKANEIISCVKEKAKYMEEKGYSIKYKYPKNGMRFTNIKMGYEIIPKFLVPYSFYNCDHNKDIIY